MIIIKPTYRCCACPRWWIALLCCCFLWQHSNAQQSTYNFAPLQSKVQSWIDSGYYNGASVIVVKNNKTIYQNYFGNHQPETVVFIASAGKWLASATIAALVDEGKLSWNDPVKKWLPEFTDIKGDATLAQLLSHTAGYPDYQPKENPIDIQQTLPPSVAAILPLATDALPGTKFKYGGLSMQVAGRMAEIATGKDWETIFQEKIAIPLGMKYTHFTPVDSSGGHAPMLGGGARSTINDYSKFLSMIYNKGVFEGKRILSEKAIAELESDQVKNAAVSAGEFVEEIRGTKRKDIYGLGLWREETDKNGRAILVSSPSWAGAYPWVDRKNGVYGFIITHIVQSKDGFSSFLSSPMLSEITRNILKEKRRP